MLQLVIPEQELWDERKQQFVYIKKHTLQLEHSLVSLSKWESKWHKPFLSDEKHSIEEIKDYVRCMTITQNVDPSIYNFLSKENYDTVNEYLNDSMTATWFSNDKTGSKTGRPKEVVTSEVIYYWMVSYNIPFECQKWHLSRLLTLIRVCNEKNKSDEKIPTQEAMKRHAELNAKRRAMWHTKG